MAIKKITKTYKVVLITCCAQLYIGAYPDALIRDLELKANTSQEQGGVVHTGEATRIEQEETAHEKIAQESEYGIPVEAIKQEESRQVSLTSQQEPISQLSSITTRVDTAKKSKSIIDTLVEIIRQFITGINSTKQFESIRPALENLDATINTIARNYQFDELNELNSAVLSTEDLKAVQVSLGKVAELLNGLPDNAQTEELRAELTSFAKHLFGPALDINDLSSWQTHLSNSKQAVNWIEELNDRARDTTALEQVVNASSAVAYHLGVAQNALQENNPLSLATELRQAAAQLEHLEALNAEKPNQLAQAIQFQDSYAALVTARAVVSYYITSPEDQLDPALKEEFIKFLSTFKTALKTAQTAQKNSSSLVQVTTNEVSSMA